MTASIRQISLPDDLCARAEKRFGPLEVFLVRVMEELLCDDAGALDEKEQRMIDERLRELGYL